MLTYIFTMTLVGIFAGILGALLGLGGGIVITPVLTLLFGVDIKYAVGASIIAVLATSSGSAIAYLKDDMLNLRIAMFLEIFTTLGIKSSFFKTSATLLDILLKYTPLSQHKTTPPCRVVEAHTIFPNLFLASFTMF